MIDFDYIEQTVIPRFNGGEGETMARILGRKSKNHVVDFGKRLFYRASYT
mgnify:CR=1 FL=1